MPAHPASAIATSAAPASWVRWNVSDVARSLAPEPARKRARHAARAVLSGLQAMAAAGHTPVSALIDEAVPSALRQYPQAAPVTGRGFLYYYHCHDARETPPGEHGHFHVFARNADGSHTHLVGIAVDASGWPLRLFTTNRWVTDETMAPAGRVLTLAGQVACRRHRDALSRWLLAQMDLFHPQLEAVLRRRDARLRALRRGRQRGRLLEDRRIRVLSQCRISLPAQVAALDRVA